MKISNIKISNFRNITAADINFSNINILTGKNSSGKTNFLLALSNAVSLSEDQSEIFSNNVVTVGQGRRESVFDVTLENLNRNVCYVDGDIVKTCISPTHYSLYKALDKNGRTKRIKLLFSGKLLKPTKNISWEDYKKNTTTFESDWINYDKETVYEKAFDVLDSDGVNKTVKTSGTAFPYEDEFLSQIRDYRDAIKSWIDADNKYDFSSSLIHKHVTEIVTREEVEEVLARIKNKNQAITRKSLFKRAKFINLIADIQSDTDRSEQYKKEIALYTEGILREVSIGQTKVSSGEIVVESPNGARGISSISSGTAVLVYFITLKNWLNLPYEKKSFQSPSVMIFDEIDSTVHPTLLSNLIEVLRSVSRVTQLFITTHSPLFLDFFEKTEIFLLKDSMLGLGKNDGINRCNIFDYKTIIEKLPPESADNIQTRRNSDLFVSGLVDSLFNG